MNTLEIVYSKQARTFVEQHLNIISFDITNTLLIKALKKLLKEDDTNSNVIAMQGQSNLYRIRKGKLRLIFRYEHDEIIFVYVERIDFRGNVYSAL
jgi:mRNA-degrading endonuclease RelE of RelBE toxin-antitoxin system